MICRIPSVVGILLVGMLAHSVLTDRIAHAQEQSSPTQQNSDARLQAEITFWQAIENSEDARDFEDYLEQFPEGQFMELAKQGLAHAEIATRGRYLLNESVLNISVMPPFCRLALFDRAAFPRG